MNVSKKLREDSIEGFKLASRDLIVNLDVQLQLFKKKVKDMPQEYKITKKPGYTGGGSIDMLLLLFIASAGGIALRGRRR